MTVNLVERLVATNDLIDAPFERIDFERRSQTPRRFRLNGGLPARADP